jgi:MFS family permease
MAQSAPPQAIAISVVAYRPERWRPHLGIPAQAGGGCSCCCCCCLHTIGGLIGAAVAPALGDRYQSDSLSLLTEDGDEGQFDAPAPPTSVTNSEAVTSTPPAPLTTQAPPEGSSTESVRASALIVRRHSAVRLFWWTLTVLAVFSFVCCLLTGTTDIVAGLFLILIGLPAIQLAAIVVTAVILTVWRRPDKEDQFELLGKLTFGWFVGTLFGAIGTVAVLFLIVH